MLLTLLYRIYAVFIFLPIFILATFLTAVSTALGCILGYERIFSQWPGRIWSWITIRLSLSRITIEGREHIPTNRYCVVTANHQSAFDIWALYGYMNIPFKWVLKGSLSRVPFVGWACRKSGFIFVDNSSPERAAQVVTEAEDVLQKRYHIFIFPEGTRSLSGKLGKFKKGAFKIALDTQSPILPISINGAYEILDKKSLFPRPGHIHVVIHPMIESRQYNNDIRGLVALSQEAQRAIASGLHPQYQNN